MPARPPRRSNAPIIAVILAVTLLLCGGVATAGVLLVRKVKESAEEAIAPINNPPTLLPEMPDLPGLPGTTPEIPGGTASRKIKVTYEVTGDGLVEIVYLAGAKPVRVDDVKLPWKFSAEMDTPALLSVVAMRVDSTEGTIGCRALVDGGEVKKNESAESNFAAATCTHLVLE